MTRPASQFRRLNAFLRVETLESRDVPSTVVFTDDFNRANSANLGANWTTTVGSMGVTNNASVSAGATNIAVVNGVSNPNVSLQADVQVPTMGQSDGLVARYGGTGDVNYYRADLFNYNGTAYARIYSNVNGTITFLSQSPVATGSGTLRFEVTGSSQRLFFNNALVAAANDTALTTGGVGIYQASSNVVLDNFSVTDITPVAQTVPFSDDFNTSPNGGLNTDRWTNQSGAFRVTGGVASGFGDIAVATVNGINEANVSIQADVTVNTRGQAALLIARYSGPGDQNYYRADLVNYNGSFYARIYSNVNGITTYLNQTQVSSGTGTLRFDVAGPSLKLFFNGNLAASANDSALTTGSVGMLSYQGATFDNFTASRITVPAPRPLPFTDNFNTSTSGQLNSADWTNQQGQFQVISGVASGQGTVAVATVNGVDEANAAVQADVTAAAGQSSGLLARTNGSANFYMADVYNINGTNYAEIWRNLNGTFTRLALGTVAGSSGTLRFEASGTSLKLFFNNTLAASANDAAFATGSVGMRSYQGGTFDNFSAAKITVTPQNLPYADTFSTSTNQQLDSNVWTNQRGLIQVINGVATTGSGSEYSFATLNGLSVLNAAAQADVNVSTVGQTSGLMLRYTDTNRYLYADVYNYFGTVYARIFQVQGGAFTLLNQMSVGSATIGLLRFAANGSSLSLFLNGSLIASATDMAPTAGTVGISSSLGGTLDNFIAS